MSIKSPFARELTRTSIEDEMKHSYIDYAMSVIVGRALPDVRDGFKPVHRRVLYAMHEMKNNWNQPYKKSARVVGDVLGKYHPHGDTAAYDAIVRMAQPFSLRYVLVDGQGNFGSVDGDSAAAMRYTEVRMMQIAHEMLEDIDKETVDFSPNYDESEQEPQVLPARLPNLLINGSSGIAVGMATNMPPHNLNEVVDVCIVLNEAPETTIDELIKLTPGPDFPTAAIINGVAGIHEAYRTGRGKVYLRARSHIETSETNNARSIVVTELPYQVNKARLLEKIAELVKDKKLTGIRDLRDESDKDGIRMVVELRRNETPEVMLNNLYKMTPLQSVFGINNVVLHKGQPQLMNLKGLIAAFLEHRREIVVRRTLFNLKKARNRSHLLEGLGIALANVDEVIALIKSATSPAEAKQALIKRVWQPGAIRDMLQKIDIHATRPEQLPDIYGLKEDGYSLSPQQAQAILELRLQKLTALEQDKITGEYAKLLKTIADLLDILSRPERITNIISDELTELKNQYGDARRTEIIQTYQDLSIEDLINEKEMVVMLSHTGYAKSQPLDVYRSQKRGGKGKSATAVKEEDFINTLFIANTHDTILCFTSFGQAYWLKVYELPEAGRGSKGKPIVNLLPLQEQESVDAILPVKEFDDQHSVLMATADGTTKKTPLSGFSRPRANGIRAITLAEDNHLVAVEITDGNHDVMLFSTDGKAVRFNETEVRSTGRNASGVRGLRLEPNQRLVSLIITSATSATSTGNADLAILTVSENGYGKRTKIEDYSLRRRGGKGVISIQTSQRNGAVIGAVAVAEEDEIMLISDQGRLIRLSVSGISIVGRNTQGVCLVKLDASEKLKGVKRIVESDSEKAGVLEANEGEGTTEE